MVPADGPVGQGDRVVVCSADRNRGIPDVKSAGAQTMTAHERKHAWPAAATAQKFGAAGLDRRGFCLEAHDRKARPHRHPVPNRDDRTCPQRRTLGQVVDVQGAPMRLKKERARAHRRSMDDDVTIGMRAYLERGGPQWKRANAPTGAT